MQYIVLDLEWNQPFSKEQRINSPVRLQGEIVQIGAVKLDENFATVDTFKMMVSPRFYTVMNHKVCQLTGIHTSDIKRGYTFPTAFKLLMQWCGEEFVILTWGGDDLPMLKDNLALHGIPSTMLPRVYNLQPIYDAQIAKENRQCSLTAAMERLGEPPFEAHDALNDALSAACVCRHLDMEKGFADYADLIRSPKLPKIANRFPSVSAAKYDREVCTLVCPSCRKIMYCEEWVSYRRGRLMGLADCVCGEKYYARMLCIREGDNGFRVSRQLTPRTIREEAYYYQKKEANRLWYLKQKEQMITK